jgi:hypothetical protein
MTDQPTPETTDSSLEQAEKQAALEAERQAAAEAGGDAPPVADAANVIKPRVVRASARTSEPQPDPNAALPNAAPRGASSAGSRPTNGSGNGSHRDVIGASADMVRADTVSVHQGSIKTAEAATIDIHQGAAARVDARDVTVTGGAIGFARADRISVELGATGAAIAREAHITQAAVNSVIARDAHVEQSLVQTVVAANVHFERPTAVVFLVARKVEGEVRAVLDWRGALVFGIAAGFVMSLFRRRR